MSLYTKLIGMAGVLVLTSPLVFAQTTPATTTTTTTTTTIPVKKRPMGIEARQRRQQKRIAQGVNSGQLTAGETSRLEKREAGIERREDRMRAQNGGTLKPGQRKAINKQLNSTSKAIYRDKHNRRTQQNHK